MPIFSLCLIPLLLPPHSFPPPTSSPLRFHRIPPHFCASSPRCDLALPDINAACIPQVRKLLHKDWEPSPVDLLQVLSSLELPRSPCYAESGGDLRYVATPMLRLCCYTDATRSPPAEAGRGSLHHRLSVSSFHSDDGKSRVELERELSVGFLESLRDLILHLGETGVLELGHAEWDGMVLRACYAMSGTDVAYAATCLRACYAMSGTDLANAATREPGRGGG
eukprot:2874220-Rhodomonas_salina.6